MQQKFHNVLVILEHVLSPEEGRGGIAYLRVAAQRARVKLV